MLEQSISRKPPLIAAHRGAPYLYPEHTMAGYKKAVALGADYIELDLVMTKDSVLVVRHEPYLSSTTNVAQMPIYKRLKNTKVLDGVETTDWFVSDFTLAELKTLRTRQSHAGRPKLYDGLYEIPTFNEVLAFVKTHATTTGNNIGLFVDLKHPTFHEEQGLPVEDVFLKLLEKAGYTTKDAPIYVQCFEVHTLQYIRCRSSVKLIQLISAVGVGNDGTLLFTKDDGSFDPDGQPYDFKTKGDERTYQYFSTEEGMEFVATYANAIGPSKPFIISYATQETKGVQLLESSNFVALAHAQRLKVFPYTFKNEDTKWRAGVAPESEYILFFESGVDGVFTDYTSEAISARNEYLPNNRRNTK